MNSNESNGFSLLVVNNTQPTDGGLWSCIVKKQGGKRFVMQVTVKYAG